MAILEFTGDFPRVSESDWRKQVDKALKGASFDEAMLAATYDGIGIKPLYTRDDALDTGALARAWLAWDISQACVETDPATANAVILSELHGGATSILLQLAAPGQTGLPPTVEALERALRGVDLAIAPIRLSPGTRFDDGAKALTEAGRRLGADPDRMRGGFGADPIGTLARTGSLDRPIEDALDAMARLAETTLNDHPRIRTVSVDATVYHEAGASEAQELACLLGTTAAYLRAMDSRLRPDHAFEQMSFVLAADADLFLTVAKLRAARALLARMGEVCGAPRQVTVIRAMTSQRMMAKRDADTNLLRAAVACTGAALGQADAITVLPFTWLFGKPTDFARRVARNTQIVLQEESYLGRVADPANGSWAIEQLTRALAKKAWGLFQDIEREGGIVAGLESGTIRKRIDATADARAKDVASGQMKLTGVTVFAPKDERSFQADPWDEPEALSNPAISIEPLALRRLAEPHEQAKG